MKGIMFKDSKVGDTVIFDDNISLVVTASFSYVKPDCDDCYFNKHRINCEPIACLRSERSDDVSVKFVKI
jgi:hypothetical protein